MMKKCCVFLAIALFSSPSFALKITVEGIEHQGRIPAKFAFCQPDGAGKTTNAPNINPAIRWAGIPREARSFALLVVDKDVPTAFDDANQEGKTIAKDFPRRDFYHWVLVDIPRGRMMIEEGEDSNKHQPKGKQVGKTPYGINGTNDFASFMKGTFGGYDGPCPPWNDERLHHYHFQLYALKVESLGLEGMFTGQQVMEAIKPYIVAQAEWVGTYTNHPHVK